MERFYKKIGVCNWSYVTKVKMDRKQVKHTKVLLLSKFWNRYKAATFEIGIKCKRVTTDFIDHTTCGVKGVWEVCNQFFKRRHTENSLFFFFLSLFKEDHHSSSRISPFLQIKVLCVHLYLHSYISPKSTHCNSQGCHFGSSIIFFNDFFASFPPEKFP